MKKVDKTKLCSSCQANDSCQPSVYALNSIYEIQCKSDAPETVQRCEWYVNSSEYGYCFWRMLEDIDGQVMSDKDICNLLLLTPAQYKEALESAILKLKKQYDAGNQDVVDYIESLFEKVKAEGDNDVIYTSQDISSVIDSTDTKEEIEESVPKKKPRRSLAMPVHRDGKKSDLYGLYSPKKLEELREKRNKSK